jgi:GrpB-like predicted nucleotidyltransferase (UPF0157 family)
MAERGSAAVDAMPAGGIAVDLGCGADRPVTAALADAGTVVGVDRSATRLRSRRREVPAARLVRADVSEVRSLPRSVDLLMAFSVFDHLPRPTLAVVLGRIETWLRYGGRLMASSAHEEDLATIRSAGLDVERTEVVDGTAWVVASVPHRPVVLEPWSAGWAGWFEQERAVLQEVLGLRAVVEHVGSTAVPGLAAKPVLDVLVGLPALGPDDVRVREMEARGYHSFGEYGLDGRVFFTRPGSMWVHVHVVERGGEQWRRHLMFRDAMRGDAGLAEEYAALKRSLAERYADDRETYTDAKAAFVEAVLDRAHGGR